MKYFLEKVVLGNAPLSQTPEVSPETAQQYTACPRAVGLGGASPTNKPKRGERETLNLRRRPTRLEKTRSPHRKPKHLPARGVSDSYSGYAFRLSAFRQWIAKSQLHQGCPRPSQSPNIFPVHACPQNSNLIAICPLRGWFASRVTLPKLVSPKSESGVRKRTELVRLKNSARSSSFIPS